MIWAILPLVASLSHQALSEPQPETDSASLARIRRSISQPNPLQTGIVQPTFRVAIEQRNWNFVAEKPNPWENPAPPGGLHAFEQRQRLGNPWANQPLVQIDMLPIAERLLQSVKDARYAHSERASRKEVLRALEAYCSTNVCDVAR
jgi:hypothetical protein